MTTKNLLVELFVEELPPKALKKLGDAFAGVLADQLKAQGLAAADAVVTPFASPRRLAAHVTAVSPPRPPTRPCRKSSCRSASAWTPVVRPTPALLKRLAGSGVPTLPPRPASSAPWTARPKRCSSTACSPASTLAAGLQKALDEAIAKLPIPKVMSYQLETDCELPGWTSVNFVRPAHGLVALHGADVVPVKALGLTAGNSTHGHRFEAAVIRCCWPMPTAYAATLAKDGAVIAVVRRAQGRDRAPAGRRGREGRRWRKPIEDDALLDEVTALVERPTCSSARSRSSSSTCRRSA